jgi:hypothetical protein
VKHFDIPDEALWGFIGYVLLAVANSVRRWQKDRVESAVWKISLLTKVEHATICEANQKAITTSLDKIDSKLDEQNKTSATQHAQNLAAMGQLSTRVAVLESK